MSPVVSTSNQALAGCINDLDKRLQAVERQLYLIMWLTGIVGSVLTAMLTAILVKLVA